MKRLLIAAALSLLPTVALAQTPVTPTACMAPCPIDPNAPGMALDYNGERISLYDGMTETFDIPMVPHPAGAAWTAMVDVPWATVSPASGNGSATLRITVKAGGPDFNGQVRGTLLIASGGQHFGYPLIVRALPVPAPPAPLPSPHAPNGNVHLDVTSGTTLRVITRTTNTSKITAITVNPGVSVLYGEAERCGGDPGTTKECVVP